MCACKIGYGGGMGNTHTLTYTRKQRTKISRGNLLVAETLVDASRPLPSFFTFVYFALRCNKRDGFVVFSLSFFYFCLLRCCLVYGQWLFLSFSCFDYHR
jgi:hypothetical protein